MTTEMIDKAMPPLIQIGGFSWSKSLSQTSTQMGVK
jgi:hypothetical protein